MFRGLFFSMLFSACLVATSVVAQETNVAELRIGLDLTWIMAAGALVMFMQVGFLLLEAGMVRSKNSINVAQKNMLDFVFAVAAFAIGGFMIAFAHSETFFPGFDVNYIALNGLNPWEAGFFVFQIMFCGTAATIVSGAVAERMRLSAYIWGSLFLSGVIYPVFVHWAWGGALGANPGAFLGNAGFIDFAGSTVVHATGGWISLAACILIGAREGRFDENGKPVRMTGHSPVLATTGALILFIGWIGFNGGSTLRADANMAMIILNTILAGGFGACAGYLMGTWQDGVVLPEKSLSGMLGGLVAVTAGCHVLTPGGAAVIGVAGGVIAIWGNDVVERRFKIDDAVGAIGVHAFAGVLGTLGLALLAPTSQLLHESRLDQFGIQLYGSVINFAWSFGAGYAFFWLLNRFLRLRVSLEVERGGLNIAEHATHIGTGHMEVALAQLISGNADFRMRLPVDRGGDSEHLTRLFNRLMDSLEVEHAELSELEALKRQSEEAERVSALSNATFEAIVMHKDGVIIDGNEQFAALVGLKLEALSGSRLLTFIEPRFHDVMQDLAANDDEHVIELELIGQGGQPIPVAARGKRINYRGENVRVECIVDLRERKAHEEEMLRMANQDPLTGLANRSLFATHLEKAIELSSIGFSSALVMIDLDRFKAVNDVHGHQAGDAVLCEAAGRLRELAGKGGVVARLGGDEFAVIRYGVEFENQAADLGLRIVRSMARPIDIGGSYVTIGSSVGIAICPTHGDSAELLSSRADVALYHSKKTGRNTYNIFRSGLDALLEKRRALEVDLENAVARGEFELHFQPRVDAKTLAVKSYEALLRWRHPVRGIVSPADFIPVAEACGKIIDIGEWVLTEAIAALGGPLRNASVSINVSPLQFQQRNFVETVERAIMFAGMDPSRVELELTESMLIEDEGRGQAVMHKLKGLGVDVALDDFGTGYSSLSYLSKYPFDTIKIDKAFVTALESEENGASILNAIIGLGAGLGMKIVAEGVETVEQAVFLIDAGCDQLQGFLLGRPQPLAQLAYEVDSGTRDLIDAELDERLSERQAKALLKASAG
jgi:ammonium transporter, Amt family